MKVFYFFTCNFRFSGLLKSQNSSSGNSNNNTNNNVIINTTAPSKHNRMNNVVGGAHISAVTPTPSPGPAVSQIATSGAAPGRSFAAALRNLAKQVGPGKIIVLYYLFP